MRPMDPRTPAILGAATAVGVAADALLRGGSPGLGFGLWAWGALIVYLEVSRRLNARFAPDALPFAALAFLCSAFVLIRASPVLAALNITATLSATALLSLQTNTLPLRRVQFVGYVRGLARVALQATLGAFGPILAVLTRLTSRSPATRSRSIPVIRGAVVTAPAFLVFAILLTLADASFEQLVLDIVGIDAWTPVNHLLVVLSITLVFAGVIHGRMVTPAGMPTVTPSATKSSSIGLVEAGMLVGALDLLFAIFVVLQIQHFFGGAETLAATPGLTAAEYARRGFFELVIVEAMAVPILLGAEAIMRGKTPRDVAAFRVLAGINLALLGGIAVSAALRLLLYRSAFGLTESRVYAGAVLVWLVAVLVVLAATVLVGRHERFTFAAIASAFLVLLTLNAANPDALIASTNLAGAAEHAGERTSGTASAFDVAYNASLSADAWPTLLDGLESLNSRDGAQLVTTLRQRRSAGDTSDWRAWNLGRRRGERALAVGEMPEFSPPTRRAHSDDSGHSEVPEPTGGLSWP